MPTIYHENSFDDQPVSCSKCQWKGTGSDTVVIDFYGVVPDKEVYCPECDKKLGVLKKGN